MAAISAAARHFLVSERVVRMLLVNKHNLVRARLSPMPRPYPQFWGRDPLRGCRRSCLGRQATRTPQKQQLLLANNSGARAQVRPNEYSRP